MTSEKTEKKGAVYKTRIKLAVKVIEIWLPYESINYFEQGNVTFWHSHFSSLICQFTKVGNLQGLSNLLFHPEGECCSENFMISIDTERNQNQCWEYNLFNFHQQNKPKNFSYIHTYLNMSAVSQRQVLN